MSTDDLMLATFWAHCVQSDTENGACQTSLVFEEVNSPYVNAGLQTTAIAVRPTWQQYFFPFRAKNSYAADEVKLGLRLGYPNQTIEFGPISLRVYDPSFASTDLPTSSLGSRMIGRHPISLALYLSSIVSMPLATSQAEPCERAPQLPHPPLNRRAVVPPIRYWPIASAS